MTLKPGAVLLNLLAMHKGGGYTLEALLGIPRNPGSSPDKHGFEIKSYKKSGKISLMTPPPDRGIEALVSFREFMERAA